MDFVHTPYILGDTIAAICTPPGEGGIAVIRISGKQTVEVAEKIFSGPVRSYKTHTIHFGKILDGKQIIDEVLLLMMLAPRSYTGEDTIEIHCHGGSLITKRVFETVIKAGARPAKPGEFTFKAFINGKIDLAQAEAVQELIGAKNTLAVNAAEKHLSGELSNTISAFQNELTDIAAEIDACLDFPEEDLAFNTLEDILATLRSIKQRIENLCSSFDEGQIISTGINLCLIGAPNAGKSSLMNALLGKERAIVTEIAGTTRDVLEEELYLGGLHFRLVDTAGIRNTQERVEKEGIRRTKQALSAADLILLVVDVTQPIDPELLHSIPKTNTLIVWNKIDLPHTTHHLDFPYHVFLSAKTKLGIDKLKETIHKMIWEKGVPNKEEIVITNARHHTALKNALSFLDALCLGLEQKISPEFLASDMRKALLELGTILGTNVTEDILSAIFSKFCIGK